MGAQRRQTWRRAHLRLESLDHHLEKALAAKLRDCGTGVDGGCAHSGDLAPTLQAISLALSRIYFSYSCVEGSLKKEQSLGRELLLKHGMPSNKDEAWRLCNFNRLNSFLSLPIIIKSEEVKCNFPNKDKNSERIIINPNKNQFLDLK